MVAESRQRKKKLNYEKFQKKKTQIIKKNKNKKITWDETRHHFFH